jgi:dTDP-4-dehydrorhamnose reductase
MKNVLISGSTGLIGSRIIELIGKDFNFIPLLLSEVDITDKDSVFKFVEEKNFDIFLHLAAYTNVNGAEIEKDLAYKVNVNGTKNIYEAVNNKNKKLIYVSTDYVFPGNKKDKAYYEDDKPKPSGIYSCSKYKGENIVKSNSMIIRLSYPYRAEFNEKKDFVASIRSALETGQEIKAVIDSMITPTFVDDIAYGLKYLLDNYSPEIFHLVGVDSLTPYDAVKLIAKKFNLNKDRIKTIGFSNYYKEYAAIRPQYSCIKSKKNTFYKMRTFEDGLNEIIKQLNWS